MNLVIADGHIKYKNVRRTGLQVLLNQTYIICDLILLAFIISSILKAPQGASGMGGKQMGGIEKKKFQVTKNVSVKFNDVAGLH